MRRKGLMKLCRYCKSNITFNPKIQKWVTSEDNWRCSKADEHKPATGNKKE